MSFICWKLNDVMAMHYKLIMTVRMSSRPLWVLGWPGTSHSVDICEGLEDWTTDLSNISDSDEDDVLLVSFGFGYLGWILPSELNFFVL